MHIKDFPLFWHRNVLSLTLALDMFNAKECGSFEKFLMLNTSKTACKPSWHLMKRHFHVEKSLMIGYGRS